MKYEYQTTMLAWESLATQLGALSETEDWELCAMQYQPSIDLCMVVLKRPITPAPKAPANDRS